MFSYAKHYFLATFVEKPKLTKIMGSPRTPTYFWSSLLSANPQLQNANLPTMKKWYLYRHRKASFLSRSSLNIIAWPALSKT